MKVNRLDSYNLILTIPGYYLDITYCPSSMYVYMNVCMYLPIYLSNTWIIISTLIYMKPIIELPSLSHNGPLRLEKRQTWKTTRALKKRGKASIKNIGKWAF